MKIHNILFFILMNLFSCVAQSTTQPDYLQKFELKDIVFIGVSSREGSPFASVVDPDGYVHVIIVGSRIGKDLIVEKILRDDVSDKVILTKIIQIPDTGNVKTEEIELKVDRIKRQN